MPFVAGYPRNLMFSLGWMIGVGIVAGLAGLGFGIWYSQRSGASKRVVELEEQLSSAQQSHEAYRQEVFGQFSDTAEKFQTLNESYVDLHQQLAKSASVLCGDMAAGPLLEGTLVSALTDDRDDRAQRQDLEDLEQEQTQEQEQDSGQQLSESDEPFAGTEEDIIVAEVPTLNNQLDPLDEDDPEVSAAMTAADPIAPTSELDGDPKVREAG